MIKARLLLSNLRNLITFKKRNRSWLKKSKTSPGSNLDAVQVSKFYPLKLTTNYRYRWVPEVQIEDFEKKGYQCVFHTEYMSRCYYVPFDDIKNMKEFLMVFKKEKKLSNTSQRQINDALLG